jgi:ribosomal protein L35AE/L33A
LGHFRGSAHRPCGSVAPRRLFAQVTTRKDAHLFVGQQITWSDVSAGATEWAEQARAWLDRARGVSR